MSFNKIIIVGNLGKDPELRYTPQGDAVANFSIATNEKRKDKSGEYQDVTTWFKVTLWRRMAENAAKYLSKGSSVYIEGRLQVEEWTDRENNNRYSLAVQASDMQFIGTRADGQGGGDSYSAPTHSGPPAEQGTLPGATPGTASGSATPGTASPAASSAPYSSPPPDDDIPF